MRIRTIKPEFFLHHDLYAAEVAEELPLRLAYIGCWCAADRDGRFKDDPHRLKVQIMPYDEHVDFSRVLHALTTRGFLLHYCVNGAWFYCIPSFSRHQVINNRERSSELPDPSEAQEIVNPGSTRAPRVTDACPTREGNAQGEGKGREGKGKEGNGENTVAVAPPVSSRFKPPTREELDLAAAKIGLPASEVDKFVNHYCSNGWKVGRNPMKSWQHSLSGWAARWREEKGNHGKTNVGTGQHVDRNVGTYHEGLDPHRYDCLLLGTVPPRTDAP